MENPFRRLHMETQKRKYIKRTIQRGQQITEWVEVLAFEFNPYRAESEKRFPQIVL